MKKFIIFFLMAFLLLSNGHTYAEKSTYPLANKLTVDRIDRVDGIDDVEHIATLTITSPTGTVTITAGDAITFSSQLSADAPDAIIAQQRQTGLSINGGTTTWGSVGTANQPVSQVYTFNTPGTYTVSVQFRHRVWFFGWPDWDTHTSSNTVTVIVNAAIPQPTITGDHAVCQHGSLTLTASDHPGFTYQWYANGTSIPGATHSTYTVPTTTTGTVNYTVACVQGSNVGTPSATHNVNVAALPTVEMTTGEKIYCGSSANITINPTYNPTSGLSYQWYLDGVAIPDEEGGTTAILTNYPLTAQSDPYEFHVEATMTAAPNCSNQSINKSVLVYEVPTFDIVPDVAHACDGGTVTLTHNLPAAEAANFAFQWLDAGGTAIGAATGESYSFPAVEGANTYQLRITHKTYDCTAEVSYTFTADVVPTVALSATKDNICVGDNFELTATPTHAEAPHGGAYTYTWYRGGTALVGPSGPTFSDGPMAVGTYNYGVSVKSTYPGCESAVDEIPGMEVHDLAGVKISIALTHHQPCDGNVGLFIHSDNYHSGSDIVWYQNGVEVLSGENKNELFLSGLANGEYTYRVVVTAPKAQGGCVEEDEIVVNVYKFPDITLTADPDVTEACEGGKITFTPNPPFALADFDYEWQQGGVPNNLTDASCTYTMGNADLEVNLQLTHKASECKTTPAISRTIQFRAQPTMLDPSIALEPNRENICVDHRMKLTAQVNGTPADYTYEWSRITPEPAYNGTLPSITEVAVHNPDEEVYPVGTYTYSVVATDKVYPGCSVGDKIEINVHEKPVIEIAGNTVYCEVPANVILEAQGELASSTYQWYVDGLGINPGGTAKQLNHPNHIPQAAPYIYSVEVTAPDLNGACLSTAQVEVVVNDNIQVTLGTPAVTTVCVGGQVELEVTDAHLYPGANYIWYRNGIAISTLGLPNFSDIYDTPGTYTYNVVGQISPGCETPPSESVVITVLDAPTATNFAIGPVDPIPGNTICDGGQITLGITDQTFDPTIPYIYAWYRNGVMIPNANMPTLTDSPLSVDQDSTYYTYNLVLISGDVCEMTADYTILVKRNPVVELVTAPNVCDVPNNIVVSIAVDGETSYFEGGHFFYKIDGVIQYDESNLGGHTFYFGPRNYPYTFQVEYIAPNGCNSFSNVAEVMVHARPEIEILAEETPICVGGDIDLTATLGNYSLAAEYTYQWYRINTNDANAIPGATLPEFSEVATTAGTHTYWLIVDNYAVHAPSSPAFRCHAIKSIEVVVNEDPTIELAISAPVICEGGEVTLTATVTGGVPETPGVTPGMVYSWYKNDVLVPEATDAVYVDYPVTVDGDVTTIIYRVEVTQTASGCASVVAATQTLEVNPNPSVQIEGDPIICQGTNITLTANVNDAYDGANLTYQWRLFNADLAHATATTATYSDSHPGSDNPYIFTVVVTNAHGCTTESAPFEVYVNIPPVVEITATENHVCVGGEVTLTAHLEDYNAPDLVYRWYANDVELYGATEATYTTVMNATTVFKVVVDQITSGCSDFDEFTVTVEADPVIAITIDEPVICEGGEVVLTATITEGVAGGEVYTWYKNDVLVPGAYAATLVDYPVTTDGDITQITYRVEVTQTAAGCASVNVAETTLEIYPNPSVQIEGDPIICDGTDISLTANVNDEYPGSNLTYQWRLFNADIAGATGDFYTDTYPDTDNPYIFTVVVTNPNGCTTESAPFYQYVNTAPVVEVTATETEICEGGEVTMVAHLGDYNSPNLVYQWYTVDGGVETPIHGASEISLTIIPTTTTTYRVRVIQTISACEAYGDVTINVAEDPEITVEIDESVICEGGEVTLTATVTGGVAGGEVYKWYKNDVLVPGAYAATLVDYPVTVDGDLTTIIYRVEVTQTAAGCASVNVAETTLEIYPNPSVQIEGDPIICDGSPVELTANVNDEYPNSELTYQWRLFNADLAHATATTATYSDSHPGSDNPYIFTVVVTNPNGCTTESAPFYQYVNTAPVVEVTATETEICEGGEVTMVAHLGDYNSPNLVYQWYTVDGGVETPIHGASEISLTIIPTTTTTYRVRVIQTISACEAYGDVTINVAEDPEITVEIDESVICEGGQLTLTTTVDGGVPGGEVYTWYRNGVIIEGATQPVLNDSPTTVDQDTTYYTYTVEVAQTASGCQSVMSESVTVLVKRNPVVELVTAPNVCDVPNNIVVSIAVDGETGYFEGGHFFYKIDGVIQYDESNLGGHTFYFGPRNYPYTFQVEYIAPNGCNSFSNVAEVMVHARPEIEILAEETPICVGGDIDLTATLGNYSLAAEYTYQWYRINTNDANAIPGATLPEFSEVATTAGTHTYWLIVDNYAVHGPGSELRCHSQQSVNIVVEDIPTVELEVNVGEICDGGQLTLTTTVDGGVPGGEVYTWYRNGVIIEGATQPVLNDSPTTVDQDTTYYTYTVEVAQTASGCQSVMSESVTVLVKRNPVVELVANPNVCDVADNIILSTAIDGETGAIPGVFIYTQDGVVHDTIHNNGGKIFTMGPRNYPYVYQVEYYSPNGCNAFSNTVEVMVHEKPEFELFVEESPICIGGDIDLSVTLSNYSISHDYTYQWYKDGTDASDAIPGATLPAYHEVATAAGTYVYYLAVDNYAVHAPSSPTFRCHAIKSIEVVVNEDPTIELEISEPVICEGGEVVLTATTTGGVPEVEGVTGGEVYTWYKNDVLVPGATADTLVDYPVTIDGDITTIVYRVEVVQSASGCASVNVAEATLEVNPNPSVQIEGDPIICQGTNITLTANVNDAYDGANLTYQWRLFNADLAHATATTATYSDSHPGSDNPYIFTVVVTNAHGCTTESAPFEVYVNIPPVVEITATENHVCVGGEVTLTAHLEDYNAPDLVYRWYANDVELYGATEATYTTVMNATTVFKVVVDQITSGCSDFDEFTVTVEADPVIAITIDEPVICEGGEVVLTATITEGVAGGEVYTWYKNDVLVPGAYAATLVDYPVTTDGDITTIIYRVEVTQTAAGCASVNVAETTLEIYPNPSVQIEGDPIICDGTDISLTANVNDEYPGSNLTYQWRLFNADIAGATGDFYTDTYPDTDNPYIFTVVVTNPNGCTTESAPFYQYVNTAPVVEVTATETEICEGGEVTMVAHLGDYNSPNLVYQWYTVDGGVETPIHGASEISLTIIPTTTTTYRVRVIQTISACEAYGDVTINVAEDPEITVEIDESVICEGGEVTLTATVTGGVAGGEVYKWYKNDVLVPGAYAATLVDYPVTVDGDLTTIIYRVEVTQTAAGCASVNVAETTLEIYPNPSVQIEGDPIICDGTDISLTANVNDEYPGSNLTYQWRLFNADIPGADEVTYTHGYPGTDNPYIFTVVVANELGCITESAPFEVYVNIPPVVEITATETDICVGGEVTLTAHLEDYNAAELVYRWYADGTQIYGATEATLTIISDATTTYTVEVIQTTSACLATDDITINVYPDPIITEIEISEDQICSGGQVTVTAHTTNLIGTPTYTWYRNGILLPEVTTAVFTESPFAIDGDLTIYTYSAYVTTDVAGCQSDIQFSSELTVFDNPVVVISGDANICETDSVFLTAFVDHVSDPVGILSYTWFESGQTLENTAYGVNIPHSQNLVDFFAPRFEPYIITVSVTRENGCTTLSEPFELYVHESPVVNITASENPICESGEVTLTANLDDYNTDMITYQWYTETYNTYPVYTGPDTFVEVTDTIKTPIPGATQQQYTTVIDETTAFYVRVLQTHSLCEKYDRFVVDLISTPVITEIIISDSTFCEGGQVTITAVTDPADIDGAIYTWYQNGVLMEGITGASFTDSPLTVDNDITIYEYAVSVSAPVAGCTSDIFTATQLVTVYGNPTVVIEGNPIVCEDSLFTLIANINDTIPGTTVTYQWRRFNEDIPGATARELTTSEPFEFGNTYMYTVVVNTEYDNGTIGCVRESEPFYVVVGENPIVEIIATDTVACEGGAITLTAVLGNPYLENIAVTWYRNGEPIYGAHSLTYTAIITETSTFYAVVSSNGCTATTEEITITMIPTPTIGAVVAYNTTGGSDICEGGEVEVTAYLEGPEGNYIDSTATYTWYRNGFLMPLVTGPWFRESLHAIDGDTTHYTYSVIVTSESANCVSGMGYSNTVTVIRNPIVIINGNHEVCQAQGYTPNVYLSGYINGISDPDETTIFKWYKNGVYQENPSFQLYYTEVLGLSYQTVTYMLEVINGNGCSAFSEPFEVFVHPNPVVNITTEESTVCVGGQVTLQGNLNDYNEDEYVFQWYRNGISVNHLIPGATQLTYTTPSLTESATYYLRVIQRNTGCVDYDTEYITVVGDPVIDELTVSATEVCNGAEVTVTAVPSNITGTAIYTWYLNGQLIEGASGPSITQTLYALGGDQTTYTYAATVRTEHSGCESSLAVASVITVVNDPHIVIAGEPIVCAGENNIILHANSIPFTSMNYQWYLNNVAIEGATDPTLITTQPASTTPYTYTVIVSGAPGCDAMSATFDVLVNDAPIVTVVPDATVICEGGEVTFTATIDNWNHDMLTYQWYHDGVLIPGATNLTYTATINDIADHIYSIVVDQLTSGCSGTDAVTVTVVADPVITSIEISEPFICDGAQVTITANTEGLVGTGIYTWYRNGELIEGVTGAQFIESPLTVDGDVTTYTYSAVVTSTISGCSSEMVTSPILTVYGNPVVGISGDAHICEDEPVNLMAFVDHVSDPVGNLTYTWFESGQQRDNLVNGIPVNSQIYLEYWYPSDQPYVFTVRVTRENGCTTLSDPFYVYVHEKPVVNITSTDAAVCEGGEVTLTANLDDYNTTNITYQWFTQTIVETEVQISATDFVTVYDTVITNIPGATTQTYTTVVDETTVYGVLVHQTISGCTATDLVTITATTVPVVTEILITPSAEICDGGQVTLTAVTEGGVVGGEVYTWYRNGVIIPGANTATIIESPLAVDGDLTLYNYTVQVTQTASGCTSLMSDPAVVTVYPTPTVQVAVTGNTTICEGGTVTLTANVNPTNTNTTYQWYVDNVLIPGATDQTYVITDAVARETDYLYTVQVTQYIGCNVTSVPVAITVVADPEVVVTIDDPVICVGGTTTLHANVTNGVSGVNGLGNYTYNWYSTNSPSTSLGTSPTLTVTGTTEQITTYWVEVVSPYGCNTVAYYYNFEVISDPTVSISVAAGYSEEVCEGGQTMLVATVQGGLGTASYQWYKNGNLLPGAIHATLMTDPLYSTQIADYSVNVVMSTVGCDATSNFNAHTIVVPAPVVDITGNTNTCPGGTVTLTAVVSGGVANDDYTYQWYKVFNGIATAINGATTSVYTTSPLLLGDSYEYYVTINSFVSGCSASSGTVQANVVPEPTVSITGPQGVCEGGLLTLTALVQGGIQPVGYTYTWTYQQGSNSGSYQTTVPVFQLPTTLPANDPASPYVFNVSIMSDQFHCDAVSASHVVNIYAAPAVTITLDHSVVCSGGTVTATANVTPVGTYNYVWTVNGAVQGFNTATITMNNLPVGNNNISLTVTPNHADAACYATAAATVTVVADPVVTITSDVTTLCAGGTVNLSVQNITLASGIPAGSYTYEWRVNGVLIPNVIGNALSQTLTIPGTYVYALRVVMNNGLGCGSDWSNEIVVTVAPQPVVTINPAGLGILDLCEGGEVTLSATVTNTHPAHGTYVYTWYSNNTNTGVSTNPYNQTLNEVGTYNYYVVVDATGSACAPVTSNVITYNVVADPTWTAISVLYPEICVGETVQLNAAVQGGVQDGSGNTNGVIHWTVWAEGGNAQIVDGGIGGTSFDTPDAAGQYYYQPTYIGQLGSGCDIDVNPITAVVVHERPTAHFAGGDGTVICGNDPNSFATVIVELTGTAPFTFTLTGSNGYSEMFTTSLNSFPIYLNPLFTGSYTITYLHDANCEAVDYPAPITIIVSHIEVLDLVAETCGETEDGSLPTVQIDVNVAATSPGMAPIAYITYLTDPAMSTQSPIYYTGSRTYIEFTTPIVPGDYPIIITIDGCDYHATVRVLVGQYNLGGTDALMQQRWDDVVVVNNNPATNGGYTFVTYQWYKDGVEIPGATHQYYQEIGGLNGFYSVKLTAETENGLVEFKTCEQFFVSQNLTKIYPVPANVEETVTIEVSLTAEELEGAVLDIFDAKGAFVRQLPVEDVIIRVSGFQTPGAYFGRITTGTNEIKTVKFVIIK